LKKLKFCQLILLIISLILSTEIYASVKAVQISYLDCHTVESFNKELVKIKKAGFNTVIFRVFNNRGDRIYPFLHNVKNKSGVYFKTKQAPIVYNLLPVVVKLCHKNKLKIVAWLTTRYLDFNRDKSLKKVVTYDFKSNKFQYSKGLTFFSNKNISYILKVFQDLLKYDIDGILLQDDVKILIDEDFNISALKTFYRQTGIKLTEKNVRKILYKNAKARDKICSSRYLTIWNNIKSRQISRFVKKLVDSCKQKRKDIKIFMNVNYETVYRPRLSKLWYSYTLDTLANTGVDYFLVMLYQIQMIKELHLNKNPYDVIFGIVKNSYRVPEYKKIIFKFQTYNWYDNKLISVNNLNKMFTFFNSHNIRNIAIFPYKKNLTLFKFE